MVLGELFELGMFIWVIDEFGHRRKVYPKSDAEKKRLLAQNKKLKAQLAKKKTTKKKKK